MDILSELIENSNWKADLLARKSFPKNCGYIFPCDKSAGFHIILSGTIFLKYKRKTLELQKGDIVFVSRGVVHELNTSLNAKAIPIFDFKEKYEANPTKNPACTFISIRYKIPNRVQHPFFTELPQILKIESSKVNLHNPLNACIQLISMEIEKGIGSDILIQRFSDIILYYCLRHVLEENQISGSWVQVMKDEKLLTALGAIHSNFSHDWSIDSLSNHVGVSKVTLTNKFKYYLKTTPMEYLAQLRIEKGKEILKADNLNLEEVARKVGYSNGFAFSKAYKRIKGVSPSLDLENAKAE